MPVKSLSELATIACVKNIKEIDSVGDFLPYESVRRILLRIEHAPQLRQIELNSPQVEGHTAEIWLKLIERDFPMEYKATAYKPANPKNWHKVWRKYKRQHDDALAESEKKLKQALAGLQETKEKNLSKVIEKKDLPRLPKKKRLVGKESSSSTLRFTSGSRTKTNSGASVMRKVRRQASEIAKIHGVFSRPAGSRPVASQQRAQMRSAPQSMLNDHKRAAQPSFRTVAQVPDPSSAVTEYEERATVLSEDDDSSGDGDGEDLFDDKIPPSRSIQAPKCKSRSSPPPHPSTKSKPSTKSAHPASTPMKKGRSLLSNSYKPDSVKRLKKQDTELRDHRPGKPSQAKVETVSRTEAHKSNRPATASQDDQVASSPVKPALATPSSPPPPDADTTAAQSRKRKSVSVFMRPNKRPR